MRGQTGKGPRYYTRSGTGLFLDLSTLRCLGVVVLSAIARDNSCFWADEYEALCERLADDVDEGRGMEERFDGSKLELAMGEERIDERNRERV
jgi:hypothetical protein